MTVFSKIKLLNALKSNAEVAEYALLLTSDLLVMSTILLLFTDSLIYLSPVFVTKPTKVESVNRTDLMLLRTTSVECVQAPAVPHLKVLLIHLLAPSMRMETHGMIKLSGTVNASLKRGLAMLLVLLINVLLQCAAKKTISIPKVSADYANPVAESLITTEDHISNPTVTITGQRYMIINAHQKLLQETLWSQIKGSNFVAKRDLLASYALHVAPYGLKRKEL